MSATRRAILEIVFFALAVCCLLPDSSVAKVIETDDDLATCREVSRIEFQGTPFLPVAELRRALAEDPDYQLAAHPATSLDEFIAIVQKRLLSGYLRQGFPEPNITVVWNPQNKQIIAEIQPGRQFRRGEIEITATENIERQILEDWLLKTRPPLNASPITFESKGKSVTRWVKDGGVIVAPLNQMWNVDSLAMFHPAEVEYLRTELIRGCASQGYFSADVAVNFRYEDNDRVTLLVRIIDEGPRAILEEIEVVGLKRNTVEELLAYLGLQTGMPITSTTQADIVRKLFESGKFLESKVKFEHKKDSSVSIKISLFENDLASSLTQPVTDGEKAACRLANWLNQLPESEVDLTLDAASIFESHVIWSFRHHTFLGQIIHRSNESDPAPFGVVLLADETGFTASSLHRKLQLSVPRVHGQVVVQMNGLTHRPDAQGHTSRILIGAGMRGASGVYLPVSTEIVIPPVMIIREFADQRCHFSIQDGIAILTRDASRLEFEADSGRLIEFTHNDPHYGKVRITTGNDLLKEALDDYHRKVEKFESVNEPGHLFTSMLRFLPHMVDQEIGSLGQKPQPNPKSAATDDYANKALQKLVRSDVLKPLDDYLNDWLDHWSRDSFRIPPEEWRKYNFVLDEGQKLAALFVPHNSWLYRVTRDWNLARNNARNPISGQILNELCSDAYTGKLGPLASWYAFAIGSSLRYQPLEVFARATIDHLTLEEIQREIDELLQPGATLTQMVHNVIAAAGNCSPEEWNGLAELACDASSHQEFLEVGRICRENAADPHDAVPMLVKCLYSRAIEPAIWTAVQPKKTSVK